jgi:L-ribulokinase
MALVMGTSNCHMLMSGELTPVEGISGVVEDGILPGLYGYEAGQAGVGDIFGWFVENGVPAPYADEARIRGISLHALLSEKAQALRAGESGLLALDWWNGCRTPLVDAGLSGLMLGYTLATRPEEVYRALIEATAYGTRLVIETFTGQGIAVDRLVATGGLTANPLLMQIYADVSGREISVAGTEQATGLGAAMLGATAAGPSLGGYASLAEASARMAGPARGVFHPQPQESATYQRLYGEYIRLVDVFGRSDSSPLRLVGELRRQSAGRR